MANPNNALGTNGAFGGRTSVNAFNDVLSTFSGRGVLSGWECVPDSGLDVNIGGVSGTRDVAIAEDPGGNKTTVNNISQAPVSVTLPAAPASNSRIDSIVAYIESSPSSDAVLDNPDAVNLLVVSGTTAASPAAPTDSQIRTAITGDGASGATAYYVVLANVTMAAGTTDIDAGMINAGALAQIGGDQLSDGSVTADKIDFTTSANTISYLNSHVAKYEARPLTAAKWGKIAEISGTVQLTGYSSGAATLASDLSDAISLGDEFAPISRKVFFGSATGNVPVRVIIEESGNISLALAQGPLNTKLTLAQNSAINISLAYMLAN